jgi:DNA-directed RNA polymerase subunit RPC12/RpoP
MPKRRCKTCGQLYDKDTAPGWRCPTCQAARTRQLQARPPTTSRGYGTAHQRERARLLAQFTPGDPCARCGRPMTDPARIDLGHTDDRTGYRGLEHDTCNRAGK